MSTIALSLPALPASIALALPAAPASLALITDIVTAREFSSAFSIDFK